MKLGGKLGSNTKTGIKWEQNHKVDLRHFFSNLKGYSVQTWDLIDKRGKTAFKLCFKNKERAYIFKQATIYKYLKEEFGIEYRQLVSKQLRPDNAIYVLTNNTFFVIEAKFQKTSGSVDEKLQTCDFKKKQWKKILSQMNCEVEYIYLLSNWFKKPEYKDTLDYIISVGCHYYFEYVPLIKLGLPLPLK
jgi:hypothetical protein